MKCEHTLLVRQIKQSITVYCQIWLVSARSSNLPRHYSSPLYFLVLSPVCQNLLNVIIGRVLWAVHPGVNLPRLLESMLSFLSPAAIESESGSVARRLHQYCTAQQKSPSVRPDLLPCLLVVSHRGEAICRVILTNSRYWNKSCVKSSVGSRNLFSL